MNEPSHVIGAAEPPLLEQTIGEALDEAIAAWPDAEALVSVHQGVRLTWKQFGKRVDDFAAGLLSLGIGPGDRVGVWALNCAEWVIAQFATARIGVIQVNINPAYRTSELEFTLRKVGVKALICTDSFKTSDYLAMVEELLPHLPESGEIHSQRLPELRHIIKIGSEPRKGWRIFADVESSATPALVEEARNIASRLQPDEAINIQFTSGTTGLPKGATLSHRNILNNALFVGLAMGLGEGDRLCIPVPLYHCFGMVMGTLACVVRGATMVLPADSFEPLAVLRAVEAERCTGLHGVPTMFIAQLNHPDFANFDLSSLRIGIMAGSPCPEAVMREVIERMNMAGVTIAYGMTETSPVSFQTSHDDGLEERVSTVGRIQPHLEVKVVDLEGRTVPRGEQGEICTRGYSVMLGYWDDPERTAEAIDADGWMHTGDLGTIDERGYCRITGRIKDMLIRGGENIYPREIEEYLMGHPAVSDVQVVGVPDEKFGEEVCACVIRKTGAAINENDLKEFCKGRIAHYKVPRYILFVDEFPMTVSGKVQKFLLREKAQELLTVP